MKINTAKLCKDLFSENIISIIITDENGNVYGVPTDPNNTDYQQYLRWLEEGNSPLPPDPIPEPEPITPQQKLESAGLTIEELKELLGL